MEGCAIEELTQDVMKDPNAVPSKPTLVYTRACDLCHTRFVAQGDGGANVYIRVIGELGEANPCQNAMLIHGITIHVDRRVVLSDLDSAVGGGALARA